MLPEGFEPHQSWSGNPNCFTALTVVVMKEAIIEHRVTSLANLPYNAIYPDLPPEALDYMHHLHLVAMVPDQGTTRAYVVDDFEGAMRTLDFCPNLKTLHITVRLTTSIDLIGNDGLPSTRAREIARLVPKVRALQVPQKSICMGTWSDREPSSLKREYLAADPETYMVWNVSDDEDADFYESDDEDRDGAISEFGGGAEEGDISNGSLGEIEDVSKDGSDYNYSTMEEASEMGSALSKDADGEGDYINEVNVAIGEQLVDNGDISIVLS